MYVVNDIAYAGTPVEGMRVEQASIVNDFSMLVRFSTGETRLFDATALFDMPVYEPLREKSLFASYAIDRGVLTWDSGSIDIAPEALYERSHRYDIPA